MEKFKSIGKVQYSPKTHLSSSDKWVILMCNDEISEYYRKLYQIQSYYMSSAKKLIRPVWGAHISIIRGEFLPNYNLWGLRNNDSIEFEYDSGVQDNGEYFWLNVYSKELEDLRVCYGLKPQPKFGFHLTIGRLNE